jgi:hypothetical protein
MERQTHLVTTQGTGVKYATACMMHWTAFPRRSWEDGHLEQPSVQAVDVSALTTLIIVATFSYEKLTLKGWRPLVHEKEAVSPISDSRPPTGRNNATGKICFPTTTPHLNLSNQIQHQRPNRSKSLS